MSNNNVIKSFFNGDIRRFNIPDQEFTTLTSMLKTTYPELADKVSGRDYVIKFEDNDGDMVTIATKGELVEAFHCLGQGKVLRLFITLKDKPAQSPEIKSTPAPSVPIQQLPQVTQTKEVKKDSTPQSAPAPQQQSKPVEKEEPLLSCLEAKALGLQLLSDNKVQAALPDALATLVNAISEGPLAIQSRLLDLSIVKSDPRCQKMVKFLLDRFGHFLPMASQALQSVGGIQGVQNMLPMMLPFIMQNLMRECGQQQPQAPPMWGPFGMPCGPLATPPPMHHFGGGMGRGPHGGHHGGPDLGSLLGMLGSMGGMGGAPGSGFFPCGTPDVDCKPDVCPEELQQSKPCDQQQQKPCDKSTAEDNKCDKEIVHEGVSCDGCHAAPIKGVRYKCSVCPNFDLCAACEALNKHIENHPMIKISKPKSAIGCGNFPSFGAGGHPFRGRGGPWSRGPGQQPGHPWGRGRSASPCWRQSQPQNPNQPGAPIPSNEDKVRANFVRDLSIPDRSETLPNQTLVKTWAVQNTGTQPWPDGVKLIFVRGDREVSTQEEFPIPPAKPNETVEVSAVLQTPATRGRYTVHYRMSDASRSFLFGPRLWCDFCVAAGGEEGKPSTASSDQKDKTTTSTVPTSTNQAYPLPQISTELPEDRFQVQLQALAKMGFANRDLNLLLLEKNNGNLQTVTEWLVKKLKDGAPEAM